MAVLPDGDRQSVWADFMQDQSRERVALPLTKTDLRAAINGLDDYIHNNATAINNAIPQPARAALSTAQKAKLMMFVITKRYLSGV